MVLVFALEVSARGAAAGMNDEPLSWKIERLRGQLVDLGSSIRQLQQSGLDSAFRGLFKATQML